MRRRFATSFGLALCLGTVCALTMGCRAPRLTAAPGAYTRVPDIGSHGSSRAQPSLREDSTAGRMAAPLLEREGSRSGGRWNREVDERMLSEVERAVRLRLEARRKPVRRCGPVEKAERAPKPTGNGDDMTGVGLDLGRFFSGMKKIIEHQTR